MKKVLLGMTGVAVLLVAVPAYIGFNVEGRYQELVRQAEQSGFQAVQNQYQRGWFGSSAETQFSLQLPSDYSGEITEPVSFTLKSEVAHGPWIKKPLSGLAEINSSIFLDGENIFPEDYPAEIRTLISFDGSGHTLVDLPATDLQANGERPAIRFSGVKGELLFDAAFKDVNLDFRMPALQIGDIDAEVASINDVQISSHSWKNSTGLMLGGGRFVIGSLSLDTDQGDVIAIDKLSIEVDSHEQDQQVNAAATYRFQGLSVADEHFGPAEMEISIDRLASAVLLNIQQAVEELGSQQMQPAQQQIAMMSILLSNGPALLEGDPRLALSRFHLETPEGVVEGQFSVQTVGLLWQDVSNPGVILEKLLASGQLKIPQVYVNKLLALQMQKELMHQYQLHNGGGEELKMPDQSQLEDEAAMLAETQLENLLSQGLLQKQGGYLTAAMNMESGLLTVNGKSIPLPFNR